MHKDKRGFTIAQKMFKRNLAGRACNLLKRN